MERSAEPENGAWGTWEELLLACAVNRHGTRSWESVAMEIQNRTSQSHYHLTPQNCRNKYRDLQRRFMARTEVNHENESSEIEEQENDHKNIPWLDELKKLRVAELRREVQRYDLSIVSLQLRVKKLKEEREQSLREEENTEEKSDLERYREEEENDEKNGAVNAVNEPAPEKNAAKEFSGKPENDESDRENDSSNESNSTRSVAFKPDPKGEKSENQEKEKVEAEKTEKPVETVAGKPDPVPGNRPEEKGGAIPSSPLDSYNGSSETIAKEQPGRPAGGEIRVPESDLHSETKDAGFQESFAESEERIGDGEKENSDVQSSVSLSRKRRRKNVSGSSSGDELENDEFSLVRSRSRRFRKLAGIPLSCMGCLETIRLHKYGSLFESRLESQESVEYQNVIRQHIDLGMVKAKLNEGLYSGSLDFFRDLLLLFNNPLVYYPKNSPEFTAASELRELVTKEMANIHKPESTPPEEPITSMQNKEDQKTNPPEPTANVNHLLLKPNPIVVCRKRSLISSNQSVEPKEEQRTGKEEKKPDPESEAVSSVNAITEQSTAKKPAIGRERTAAKGSRTNKSRSDARKISNPNINLNPNTNQSAVKAAPSNETPETKLVVEEKKNTTVAKKRSAANFLHRIKRNGAPGTLLETLKISSGNGRGEQKKGNRSDVRKEQVSRKGGNGKKTEEQVSPAKRSVGRPPKKVVAPTRQRQKEVEPEAVPSRAPRKRARR